MEILRHDCLRVGHGGFEQGWACLPTASAGRDCHVRDAANIHLKFCQDWLSSRRAVRSAEPTNLRILVRQDGPDGAVSCPSQQSETICSASGWAITYMRQSSGGADMLPDTHLWTVIRGAPAKLSIVRFRTVQEFTLCCLILALPFLNSVGM